MSGFTNFSTIHYNYTTPHSNNSYYNNSSNHNYTIFNGTHHLHPKNTLVPFQQQLPPVIPIWFHKFIFGIYILLLCVGGIGNALICFVLLKRKRKRSIHLITLNLAISDLIVCIMYVPTQMYLIQVEYQWGLGEITCQAVSGINSCTVNASIGTLIAITYDRYVAVTKPMVAHQRTTKQTKIMIFIVWLVSGLITIPLLNVTELHRGYCTEHWLNPSLENAYWISVFVVQLPLPMLYICGVYAIIIYSVRSSHTQFELVKIHNNMQVKEEEQQKQKKQEELYNNINNNNNNNSGSRSNTNLTQYVMNITRSISYKKKNNTNMRNCAAQNINTGAIILDGKENNALITKTEQRNATEGRGTMPSKSNRRVSLGRGRKQRQKNGERRKKQQNKLLKMSVSLVIAYAVCVTPQHAVFFAVKFGDLGLKPYAAFFFIVSNLLMIMNSAINPIIYGTLNDEMKKSIVRLFTCSSPSSNAGGQSSGTFSSTFSSLRKTIRRHFKLRGTSAESFNRGTSGMARHSTVTSDC